MNRDSAQEIVGKVLQSSSLTIDDSFFKVETLITTMADVYDFYYYCLPPNDFLDRQSFIDFVPYSHRVFFSMDLTNEGQSILFKGSIGNPTKLFKCSSTPNSKYLTSERSKFYPLFYNNSQMIDLNVAHIIDRAIVSKVQNAISRGVSQEEKYNISRNLFVKVVDAVSDLIKAKNELIEQVLNSSADELSLQSSILTIFKATTGLMFEYEVKLGSSYQFNRIQMKPDYAPALAHADLAIGSKNLDRTCYLLIELKKTIEGLAEKVSGAGLTRWKLNIEETFKNMYKQATSSGTATKTSLESFMLCISQIMTYLLFQTTLFGMLTDGNTWLLLNFNTDYYDQKLRINIKPAVEKMVHSQQFMELAKMKQVGNNVTNNSVESHLQETILDGFKIVENLNNPSLESISLKPLKVILLAQCLEIAERNHNDFNNIVIELQIWMREHSIFEQIDRIPAIPINICGNHLGQSNIQILFASMIHNSEIKTQETNLTHYLRKLEVMFASIYGKPLSTGSSTINSSASPKSSSEGTGLTSYSSASPTSPKSAKRHKGGHTSVEMMDKIDEQPEDIDCSESEWLDFSTDPLITIFEGERRISLKEIFGEPISYGPAQVFIIGKDLLLNLFDIFQDISSFLPDKMILKLYNEASLTALFVDAYERCEISLGGRHEIPNVVAGVLKHSNIEAQCLQKCLQYNLQNKKSPIKTSRLFGFGKFKFFNWDYGFPDFEGQFLLTEYIQPDEGGQLEQVQKKLKECKDMCESKKIKSYLDSLYYQAVDIVEELKTIGINHNDLRRSNFIIHNNQVSIIDFGNAILKDSDYEFKEKLRMVFTME